MKYEIVDDNGVRVLPEFEAFEALRKQLVDYGYDLQKLFGKYSLLMAATGEVCVGGSFQDVLDWLEDPDAD